MSRGRDGELNGELTSAPIIVYITNHSIMASVGNPPQAMRVMIEMDTNRLSLFRSTCVNCWAAGQPPPVGFVAPSSADRKSEVDRWGTGVGYGYLQKQPISIGTVTPQPEEVCELLR